MSEGPIPATDRTPITPPLRLSTTAWLIGIGFALAAALTGPLTLIGQPVLPGRVEADTLTVAGSTLLQLIAQLAALGTTGLLISASVLEHASPRSSGPRRLSAIGSDRVGLAGRVATGWALSATVLVPFNAAATGGVPVGYFFARPGDYLASSQTAQAWLLTAVLALVLSLACRLATSWTGALVSAIVATFAWLPSVVTAQVSVGAGHDLATDAAIIFTLAFVAWTGITVAASAGRGETAWSAALQRRVRLVGGVAMIIAVPARLFIARFELAGQAPWQSPYGWLLITTGLFGLILAVRWFRQTRPARAEDKRLSFAPDLVGIMIIIGLQVAMAHAVPPRFWLAQTPQQNYLGFDVPTAPTVATLLLPGRPNLLFATLAIGAISLYVYGFARLRRRGDAWPVARLITWLLGWSIVLIISTTQLWTSSSVLFSWHMLVHMITNMLVPVLIVLSGPITLALRAVRSARPGELLTVRDGVEAGLAWPGLRFLMHPAFVWLIFIGSFYALYFSPLFGNAMRYHWAHQLMMAHFLIVGSLFYGLVAGIDRPPRPLPHVAKLGFAFAAMPFHAFFAVGVLSSTIPIGQVFYDALDLAWDPDLLVQQDMGGEIAWATGELPLLIVIIALLFQWLRQDQRVARRTDRATDAGTDDSFDAYNAMLDELAHRDKNTRP